MNCKIEINKFNRNDWNNLVKDAVDLGLQQLGGGQKIPAQESYERLKNKINKLTKEAK